MHVLVLKLLTFSWSKFLNGFCTHLLLPALLLLLIGLLLGRIGRTDGVPCLVRHDSRFKQFFDGLALTVLCCKTLLMQQSSTVPATPGGSRGHAEKAKGPTTPQARHGGLRPSWKRFHDTGRG